MTGELENWGTGELEEELLLQIVWAFDCALTNKDNCKGKGTINSMLSNRIPVIVPVKTGRLETKASRTRHRRSVPAHTHRGWGVRGGGGQAVQARKVPLQQPKAKCLPERAISVKCATLCK